MIDSEDDLFCDNMTFQASGPSVGTVRNNISGMLPAFKRPRFTESWVNQRYHRSNIPSMFMPSAYSMPRNFCDSYSQNGIDCDTSAVFSARGSGSASVKSTDSTSSITEIALAFRRAEIELSFQNAELNPQQLKLIRDSYRKFMKKHKRKIISKRSIKSSKRRYRADSTDISGDVTSDTSSLSSNSESPKTNHSKKNNNLSIKSNVTYSRPIGRENNTYKKNSEKCNSHVFENISSIPLKNANTINAMPKDRFKKGYALPFQRFNSSTVHQESSENFVNNNQPAPVNENALNNKNVRNKTDSEDEEIFSNILKNTTLSGVKRIREDEDISRPKKKKKISETHSNVPTAKKNDFNFAKPKLPIRKNANTKWNQGKLISSTLLNPNTLNIQNSPKNILDKESHQIKEIETNKDQVNDSETTENKKDKSDVSMRQSFTKRKLFTQRLEIAEKRNYSSDNIQSPQTEHCAWLKDKTKPRKLVTTQSCLTRDINDEDSNLADLISKYVPVNKHPVLNKTSKIQSSKANMNISNEKTNNTDDCTDWDIASIISTCNPDSASDTYTDEEIFQDNKKSGTAQVETKKQASENPLPQNLVADDLLTGNIITQKNLACEKTSQNSKGEKSVWSSNSKNHVMTPYKSFWDTDLESDIESFYIPKKYSNSVDKTVPSHNEISSEQTSTNGNGSISTISKENEGRLDECIKQNPKVLIQKIDMTSNVISNASHKTDSFNLRERLKRTPKKINCCGNESKTENMHKNRAVSMPYTPSKKVRKQKNTADEENNKLSDLSNELDTSKCLRSRTINCSNNSVTNLSKSKVKNDTKRSKSKLIDTPNKHARESIISFNIKDDSIQNGKATNTKKQTSKPKVRNKTRLNTSVQTRSSIAANKSINVLFV